MRILGIPWFVWMLLELLPIHIHRQEEWKRPKSGKNQDILGLISKDLKIFQKEGFPWFYRFSGILHKVISSLFHFNIFKTHTAGKIIRHKQGTRLKWSDFSFRDLYRVGKGLLYSMPWFSCDDCFSIPWE